MGLTAVHFPVKHPNPQFEGQTKTKLGNREVVKTSIASAISDFHGKLTPSVSVRFWPPRLVAAKRAREVTVKIWFKFQLAPALFFKQPC